MMRKIYLILIVSFFAMSMQAQNTIKDSLAIPLPSFHYKTQIPYGDIAKRFGVNHDLGFSFNYKLKSNWIFGAEMDFITGVNVKNKDGLLSSMKTDKGYVISEIGLYADIAYYQRGFTGFLTAGRVFPVSKKNPNSGIMVTLGGGFIQYKNYFESLDENVPQIDDDYIYGYDRMVNGWAAKQFLGYLFLSDSKLINFYAGFEVIEGWTSHRRSYNFDLRRQETDTYFDILVGIKVGWLFPVYRRAPKEYFVN